MPPFCVIRRTIWAAFAVVAVDVVAEDEEEKEGEEVADSFFRKIIFLVVQFNIT